VQYVVCRNVVICSCCVLTACRTECVDAHGRYYMVGVQHVSPADIVFMMNRCPTVRSMPVAVMNFTLNGDVATPCDPHVLVAGGPFLSYVREDEDYHAVMRRFGAITGDREEACKLRLAVVREGVPYFLPRVKAQAPPHASGAALNGSQATQMLGEPAHSGEGGLPRTESLQGMAVAETTALWELLSDKFPAFARAATHRAGWHTDSRQFPLLGIQRSAAEVNPKTR
jgi:hypothetical protein